MAAIYVVGGLVMIWKQRTRYNVPTNVQTTTLKPTLKETKQT